MDPWFQYTSISVKDEQKIKIAWIFRLTHSLSAIIIIDISFLLSSTESFKAYCSLRNEMGRNEMGRNEMERNEMGQNEMEICSLRNGNL